MQGAAYVVVEGLHFRSPGYIKMDDCDHCRISRFRIQRQEAGGEIDWVTVSGTSKYCRIDHNDFGPQRQVGNMIMLSGAGAQIVQYTRIDHNYFHDVTYGGGNGWELIRAGLSGWTFSKAFTVIEQQPVRARRQRSRDHLGQVVGQHHPLQHHARHRRAVHPPPRQPHPGLRQLHPGRRAAAPPACASTAATTRSTTTTSPDVSGAASSSTPAAATTPAAR